MKYSIARKRQLPNNSAAHRKMTSHHQVKRQNKLSPRCLNETQILLVCFTFNLWYFIQQKNLTQVVKVKNTISSNTTNVCVEI